MKQVVVITGGAGGMGLATAKIAGKESTILIADVSEERLLAAQKELSKLKITSEIMISDITSPKSIKALTKKAKELGDVKALIHTAGVSPQMSNAATVMKINALGTVLVNEAFLKIAKPGFAAVNVASMGGYSLPGALVPKRSYKYALIDQQKFLKKVMKPVIFIPTKLKSGMSYAISKNFVIWYSKAMADAFGKRGARIVSLSPGSINTRMGQIEKDHGAGSMADISALKRFGEPNEIAEVLAFLASDKASYITGTDILVDGGTIAAMKIHGKRAGINS